MKLKILILKTLRIYPKIRTITYIQINKFIFWLNGVIFGKNLRVYDRFYLSMQPHAKLKIGDNFKFSSGDGINPLCRNIRGKIFIDRNASLLIGDNSGMSSACIWVKEQIKIGSNVKIGGDCIIMDTDAHNLDFSVRAGGIDDCRSAKSAPIIIKNDVLIGARCIILKGVTIGARSIIAAGSVVTKSIPDDCVAGGNPCRVIKYINGK